MYQDLNRGFQISVVDNLYPSRLVQISRIDDHHDFDFVKVTEKSAFACHKYYGLG